MNKRDFNVVGNEGTDNQELAKGIAFIKSRRAELNVVQMVENMRDQAILNGCETGEAKITKAYNLPCDYVIHTVGPIWNAGRNREEELLANCYFNSMKLAMDNGIRSIAFPSISTGVYSFPVELAAKIAVHTVNRFLQDNPDCFDLVEWVLFDTHTESVYEAEVDKLYDK